MSTFQEHYNFEYLTSTDGKTFQPKQKNRFAIYMTRLPAAVSNDIEYTANDYNFANQALLLGLQTFTRPSYNVNVVEIPNYNNTFLYPGKDTSERSISATFIDSHAFKGGDNTFSPASILYRWYMLVNDKNFNTIGYKDYFTTDIRLYGLFPTGQVCEYWRYYEVWPTSVDFGDLSYGDSEFMEVNVTFRYERARLISEEIDETTSGINVQDGNPEHVYEKEVIRDNPPAQEVPFSP